VFDGIAPTPLIARGALATRYAMVAVVVGK
jgi:hypothetical protein